MRLADLLRGLTLGAFSGAPLLGVKFVLDVSGSMYTFNRIDKRLDKLCEVRRGRRRTPRDLRRCCRRRLGPDACLAAVLSPRLLSPRNP